MVGVGRMLRLEFPADLTCAEWERQDPTSLRDFKLYKPQAYSP